MGTTLSDTFTAQAKKRLGFIYGDSFTDQHFAELFALVKKYKKTAASTAGKWTQKDAILITYGDSIKTEGEAPLKTLGRFLNQHLKDSLSSVHILPFFPFSSDDGFSVIDYMQVNPELGDWDNVTDLSKDFDLMFDLVINHISQHSQWFQAYLKGQAPESGYFIEEDPATDLSAVTRPRNTPVLSPYQTANGTKYVWTTFSADQIDLNFANPLLLIAMMDVLLYYAEQGAKIIRLDAIAFLWKKIGTTCLHLPQTHEVVKLMRDILQEVDPTVILLTETNVPNKENLSYFGDNDEAHMVYQFSLPPLLLYALHTGNPAYLKEWARSLPAPPPGCTYFNFTASHDGVGVRPLEGLLPEDQRDKMLDKMREFGGDVSYKSNSDGSQSPYEINITYFSAMSGTSQGKDHMQLARFICSQTVMMGMQGIPAFYLHSLTATPNWTAGVAETGRARTINRMKWDLDTLNHELTKPQGSTKVVFDELRRRLKVRAAQPAFHPDAAQEIPELAPQVFAVVRKADGQTLLSLANVGAESIALDLSAIGFAPKTDLLSGLAVGKQITLAPYQVAWLV